MIFMQKYQLLTTLQLYSLVLVLTKSPIFQVLRPRAKKLGLGKLYWILHMIFFLLAISIRLPYLLGYLPSLTMLRDFYFHFQ